MTQEVKPKREKIMLGGYELWLEYHEYPCLMLYNSEKAQHGLEMDVLGTMPYIKVNTWPKLTDVEQQEIVAFLIEKGAKYNGPEYKGTH